MVGKKFSERVRAEVTRRIVRHTLGAGGRGGCNFAQCPDERDADLWRTIFQSAQHPLYVGESFDADAERITSGHGASTVESVVKLDWGDVAGWVGAGVGLVSLGGSVVASRSRGRAQASKVAAWQNPERPQDAWLANGSDGPVYDVVVSVTDGGRTFQHSFSAVPAGGRVQVPLADGQRIPSPRFAVEFTDQAGRHWRRVASRRPKRVRHGIPARIKGWVDARRDRGSAENRAALMEAVLLRATVLGVEVLVDVSGHNPAIHTYHPTGRRFALYPDLASYRRAAERREVNPANAHYGKPRRPVHRWTDDELRAWIRKHADQLPADAGSQRG